MTAYRLSALEVWTLMTLATLPVETDSILSVWLSQSDVPEADALAERGLGRLQAKGYLAPDGGRLPDDLLEALALLALSRTTLTTVLRRAEIQIFGHFAQVGSWLTQYMPEDRVLLVHPPESMSTVAASILPPWFQVQAMEDVHLELPLGALAMLISAFELGDVRALVRTGEGAAGFSRAALIDHLETREEWLDSLAQAGVSGMPRRGELPTGDHMSLLLSAGLLQEMSDGQLVIGKAAAPLHETFGDPDVATLTVSLQTSDGAFSRTGTFVYGGGRLFMLTYVLGGMVRLDQLAGAGEALAWTAALLAEGARQPVTITPWEEMSVSVAQQAPMPRTVAPKYCPYCGTPVARPTAKFCIRCGRPLR